VAARGGNPVKRIRRLLCPRPTGALAPFLAAGILIATCAVSFAGWKATVRQDPPPATETAVEKGLPPTYAKWVEGPVSYIITPREKTALLSLPTNEERDKFIEQFWERRNPNTNYSTNPFKEEFYRRVAYADKHFAYSGIPGWKTDKGHVYICWGPPDEINSYSRGASRAIAMDLWTYSYIPGIGVRARVTFLDRAGNGDYRIASSSPSPGQNLVVRPIVSSVNFESSITVPSLGTMKHIMIRRLAQVEVNVGLGYDRNKAAEAKEIILQAYLQRGISVHVDEKVSEISPGHIALTFIISHR
jgi:GWxTD domain-containing protein